MGRCSACGAWNSFVEELQEKTPAVTMTARLPQPITEIDSLPGRRVSTGMAEFDRVLGGGVVPGSVILIGGDPGIGKSTLLMQAMHGLAAKQMALYVTGEESAAQVRLRAERLQTLHPRLYVLAETRHETVAATLRETKPAFVCIDSIQTQYSEALPSAAGSVGQIREVAARLVEFAKQTAAAIFLIGHVTKEGSLAGPRVLEHMVDTVLYFEGERGHPFRILRAIKNRFGSTNEIGVFEMKETGLQPVENPSATFLAERPLDAAGSIVLPSLEGTRPILVEIQALVSPAIYGNARRTAMGIDINRVNLIAAVLEKKGGLQLVGQDIFVNVAGGVRLDDPGSDLALALAIASSFKDAPVDPATVVLGELGLTGEVRGVAMIDQRLREAAKLGFRLAIVPAIDSKRNLAQVPIERIEVSTLADLLERFPRLRPVHLSDR